jgi:threonine/homoserine/homoserine lactone efflux protein
MLAAMDPITLLLFCAVALVAIATPGPTVLLALANGSRFGLRRSVPGMAGAVASDFVLVGAVALGLGALLAASEFWFTVLKYVGAAYLAWLGWRLLRSQGGFEQPAAGDGADTSASGKAIFMKSFLVAVTNPKGYLFCSALLPQFIDPQGPQLAQYVTIALVFGFLDFAVMFAYAFLGAKAVRMLRTSAVRWMDRVCGGALLAVAGSMLFWRRSSN